MKGKTIFCGGIILFSFLFLFGCTAMHEKSGRTKIITSNTKADRNVIRKDKVEIKPILTKHMKMSSERQVFVGIGEFMPVSKIFLTVEPKVKCRCLSKLGGPKLSKINIILTGTNSANLYLNGYLQGHPDQSHFNIFGTIPDISIPTNFMEHSGGTLSRIKLYLDKIYCTSKYGGSIALKFKMEHDIEYELITPNYLFDFKDFTMTIFSNPVPPSMNHPTSINQKNKTSIHYEFGFSDVVAYENYSTTNVGFGVGTIASTAIPIAMDNIISQELENILDMFNTTLKSRSAFNSQLRIFVLGLIRALNEPLFTSGNTIVDAIQITDGRIDLITHEGVRVANIYIRVNGIDVNTERGREEFHLDIYEGTGYGFQWDRIALDVQLDQNESSSYFVLDTFDPLDFSTKEYTMHYDLVERDDAPIIGGSTIFTSPDHFDVRSHTIRISCIPLRTATLNLIADEASVNNIEIHTENMVYDLQGTMSVRYKVIVTLR